MKRTATVLGLLLSACGLFAAETSLNVLGVYSPSHHEGYGETGFAFPDYTVVEGGAGERDLGSAFGSPSVKASVSVSERVPFFVGDGPLFSGNSVRAKFTWELSPVSSSAIGQFSFSPIAFLVFDAGASVGTGWSLGPFHGLSLNRPAAAALDPIDFGGAVWSAWGAGTFQFDFGAVFPGKWSHVVLLATAKVQYAANTGAADGEAWDWENERDDYFNGARFNGTYVLAYQMPARLNLIGVMAESEEWLGSVRDLSPMASSGGWGSDFRLWYVNALANFSFGKRDSLTVIGQFRCSQDWTDGTALERYFGDRDYDGAIWYLRRVVFSYTHVFKN